MLQRCGAKAHAGDTILTVPVFLLTARCFTGTFVTHFIITLLVVWRTPSTARREVPLSTPSVRYKPSKFENINWAKAFVTCLRFRLVRSGRVSAAHQGDRGGLPTARDHVPHRRRPEHRKGFSQGASSHNRNLHVVCRMSGSGDPIVLFPAPCG